MSVRTKKCQICIFVLSLLLLTSCSSIRILSIQTPTPTAWPTMVINTPEPTATQKIIWFPPTATALPLNTPTAFPTSDDPIHSDVTIEGNLLNDSDNWQTFRSEAGNVVLSDDEITLAIQETASSIVSYASTAYHSDYYLSATVTVSMCQYAQDSYGILFRVKDSENYYAWEFNCLGQTRLLRRYQGGVIPLHDWSINGKIRPGAPQQYAIGIKADGNRLSLYLNEDYQYGISDTTHTEGSFGLEASSAGYYPLTISFSEMKLYQTE